MTYDAILTNSDSTTIPVANTENHILERFNLSDDNDE